MSETEAEQQREEHLARLRIKRDAYVAVFGPPGNPTPFGAVILADIDGFCAVGRESVHFDQTGRMDPFTTIYRDGKKAVAERIHKMREWHDDDSSSGT